MIGDSKRKNKESYQNLKKEKKELSISKSFYEKKQKKRII